MHSATPTLNRFVIEEQRRHPEARGHFSALLEHIAFAAKIVNREVNKAGLVEILGLTGAVNVQGEEVQKLDAFAQTTFFRALDHSGLLCCMASEEEPELMAIPDKHPAGDYVFCFDPLDGSSNIDANVSIGTIFGIYRKVTDAPRGSLADVLQPGRQQVGAGYVVYGSSTILVYSSGHGVHGFTLDPSVGEFLLSHRDLRIPERGKYYSVNEGNAAYWDEGSRRYVRGLKERPKPYSLRYIGSLVADFHRSLIYGGIFLYPADRKDPKKPQGKLRLLFEASPLAYVCEQAGGRATTGAERVLDVAPTELHQRVPLIIGSRLDVEDYLAALHTAGG